MADNLELITKAGGIVTHLLDGAVRAAIFPDAVLDGLTFTRSGLTVNLSAGVMIIGGRVVENGSASSWDVPSGNAVSNIIITITSSGEISTRIASGASPVLTQEDINMDGSTYEQILAAVNVSGGAITGFRKQLPRIARNGGILYGTAATPGSTQYPDGTLYVQYTE